MTNYAQTEKVLILPKFNITKDQEAYEQIIRLMPHYKDRIEMVYATDLIRYDGCLNCASWTFLSFSAIRRCRPSVRQNQVNPPIHHRVAHLDVVLLPLQHSLVYFPLKNELHLLHILKVIFKQLPHFLIIYFRENIQNLTN